MKNTARLQAIYQFILSFSEKHLGNFPSHRVIGAAVGIKSTSLIHGYVAELERDGWVIYIDGIACVAGATWTAPRQKGAP